MCMPVEFSMLAFSARVGGHLTALRDGVPVLVPRGSCEVQTGRDIVRMLWTTEEGDACSVVLGAERFEQHIEAGAIVIVDPVAVCNRLKGQAA